MMEVWCELVCGYCKRQIVGEYSFGPRVPRRALWQAAQNQGAVKQGDDVYCCTACRDIDNKGGYPE